MEVDFYKVIVCLSSYNKGLYLEEAIESVLSQKTNFKFQILIVDDFSKDNSKEIIINYQKEYPQIIKFVFNNFNLGLIKNFIKISKLATSKYVAFLDGDDYWVDNYKLQKQVDKLDIDNSLGLIHTNYLVSKNHELEKTNNLIPSGYVYDNMILSNLITHSTVMLRGNLLQEAIEILESLPYDKFYHNDYPLYILISSKTKIEYLNHNTTVYRDLIVSASHTKEFDLKNKIIDATFFSRIYFIENIKSVPNKIRNQIKSEYYYSKLLVASSFNKPKIYFDNIIKFNSYNTNFKHFISSFICLFKIVYRGLF
jgi:glucosyltransferase